MGTHCLVRSARLYRYESNCGPNEGPKPSPIAHGQHPCAWLQSVKREADGAIHPLTSGASRWNGQDE